MRQNQDLLNATADDLYPSRWLKAEHLQNRSVVVTIARATIEQVYDARAKTTQPKVALWFAGKEKGLLFNKTQFHQLAAATGAQTARGFVGHRVILRPAIAPNGRPTIHIDPLPEDNEQAGE